VQHRSNHPDRSLGGEVGDARERRAHRRRGVRLSTESNPYWDLRIWVDIAADLSVRRGIERDRELEGGAEEAEALHRDRYLSGSLYVDEVNPRSFVEVIVDNTDFDDPRVVRPRGLI